MQHDYEPARRSLGHQFEITLQPRAFEVHVRDIVSARDVRHARVEMNDAAAKRRTRVERRINRRSGIRKRRDGIRACIKLDYAAVRQVFARRATRCCKTIPRNGFRICIVGVGPEVWLLFRIACEEIHLMPVAIRISERIARRNVNGPSIVLIGREIVGELRDGGALGVALRLHGTHAQHLNECVEKGPADNYRNCD